AAMRFRIESRSTFARPPLLPAARRISWSPIFCRVRSWCWRRCSRPSPRLAAASRSPAYSPPRRPRWAPRTGSGSISERSAKRRTGYCSRERENERALMAMVTRCPACSTTFRVAPPQLQAQQGMVRCGRCLTVFDAFKTLATVEEGVAPDTATPQVAEPQPAAVGDPVPESAALEPVFKLEPVSATELAAAAEPSREPAAKAESADDARDFGPAPEQLTIEDHLFLEENREAKARNARWWAAGAALLLIVLGGQALYVYRG